MSEQAAREARIYCSEVASLADAPLQGSAVQVHCWLLIEYARPWKPKALLDNELPQAVNDHLSELPDAYSVLCDQLLRVQFIKQASSADQVRPRVFIAHHTQGLFMREYEQLSELTDLTPEMLQSPLAAGFARQTESITLVCTNGQRDLCCARFGLPVYESLRSEMDRRVWQTTHVGGHRYAPNLLSLPSGLLFGFVSPDEAPLLQRKLDQGVMTLHRLRGRSALSPAAQAAEYYLRTAQNVRGLDALEFRGESHDEQTVIVEFSNPQGVCTRVSVKALESSPVLASCDGQPKPVKQFELLDIQRA